MKSENRAISGGIVADPPVIRFALCELVRHASQSRLRIQTGQAGVEVRTLDPGFRPGRILASNMVFILVSGDALRLTFKVHFDTRAARALACRIFGKASPDDVAARQAIDFFKEYTNLVAGNLVALLGESGIQLGISLPMATRGFYEVFVDYTEQDEPVATGSDFWQLFVGGQTLYCSAQYELLDHQRLKPLAGQIIGDESGDDGEVDFL